MKNYYLKPNVVIEPLFARWYAWSHLISPATASSNVVGRHLKIIDSYLKAPQIHQSAVKNANMRGGPFMDLDGDKTGQVKELREKTIASQENLIKLADALVRLNETIVNEAIGSSLNNLYDKVPDILKGYVELVYDLNNQPSFRLFESLLYKSQYYDEASQSIALWITENDERPFVLSTPRLDNPDVLHLDIPFKHQGIDLISSMKRTPNDKEKAKKMLGIAPDQEDLFDAMFTTNAPPKYQRYTGDKVRMRYFGHACILVETKNTSILLDPVVSYYGYQQDIDRFSDMDLPDVIDYVLITHNHQDHIIFETLLPLRHKIKNIVVPRTTSGALADPNLKLMFNAIGFDNVIEIDEMGTIQFEDDCEITGIPFIGEHCDLNIQAKICPHVKVDDFKMLFAADSCNVAPQLYEKVGEIVGAVDVVFLGMECEGAPLSWLYGPLLPDGISRDQDQSRRLAGSDFEQGKRLVEAFAPREVYVYAMGQEPWLEFISSIKYTPESHPIVQSDKLLEYCFNQGIEAERLFGEKEILYSRVKEVVAL